jgi:hypothetical protein
MLLGMFSKRCKYSISSDRRTGQTPVAARWQNRYLHFTQHTFEKFVPGRKLNLQ